MKKRIVSLFITIVMLISFITTLQTQAQAVTTIKIGDYLEMGRYYDEPILWRCVDIDENGLMDVHLQQIMCGAMLILMKKVFLQKIILL